METILILGGHGFLGSNIIDYAARFLHEKYRFIVFDFYAAHPLGVHFANIEKAYKGDFSNKEDVRVIFEENKIDYVFHFVSTTVPSTSNLNISYDIESNLLSTINLLEQCIANGVKNVFYISSGGAIYGSSSNYIHTENDPLQPNSSYGVVKLTIEKYLQLYNHLHGLNYLCLRLSNPYGLFHTSQKQGIINIALRSALSNKDFEVWGDGSNIKDYIYAEDVAKIIFALLHAGVRNDVINIGSNTGHSVNDILQMIKAIIPSFKFKYKEARSFDVPRVVLNTTKLHSYLNFKPTSMQEGIDRTFAWARNLKKT